MWKAVCVSSLLFISCYVWYIISYQTQFNIITASTERDLQAYSDNSTLDNITVGAVDSNVDRSNGSQCMFQPLQGPLFAIMTSTYHREQNVTMGYLNNLACFLNRQTYPNWLLFVTGDAYQPEDELRVSLKSIDPCRLHLANLPSPGERGKVHGSYLWFTAGSVARNDALDRIERFFNSSTHTKAQIVVACLDDDDYWEPFHLQTLASRYALYPSAKFVYTRARSCNAPEGFPLFFVDGLNNRPPVHSGMIHSTASWSLETFYGWRYHSIHEMSVLEPGDAHMWARMSSYLNQQALNFSFVPSVTVIHGAEHGQVCIQQPNACNLHGS